MYNIHFYSKIEDTVFWKHKTSTSCLEHPDFLQTMVYSNPDIQYRFAEVTSLKGELVGRLFIQLLPFKGKELKSYLAEDSSCFVRAAVETVLDKINWKMAVFGNLFVSGDDGQHWEENVSMTDRWLILNQAGKQLKQEEKVDTILFTEITEQHLSGSEELTKSGYKLFEIEPELTLNLAENWHTFNDYINDMKSKYKVRTRKVMKDSAVLEVKSLSAEEILTYQKEIQVLHENVTSKVDFKLAQVSNVYFYNLKKCLGSHFSFNAYFLDGKMIGFISSIIQKEEQNVHLIGLDYNVNKSVCLYQRILYDCVNESILGNKKTLSFGKTATTIKTTVGAKTQKVYSLLKHNSKVSNLGIQPLFKYLKPEEEEIRNPFKDVV